MTEERIKIHKNTWLSVILIELKQEYYGEACS